MSTEPTGSGLSQSERYLSRLCRRTFLSLWSYPNLYRSPAKELADLVVVFGDDVVIFSDKCCAFPGGDIPLAWSRWYRRAVAESVHQLRRAEAWMRNHPDRIFTDARCAVPFPLRINPGARIHLVAVAIGATQACRAALGGSGSLILEPAGAGQPFRVCELIPDKTFVHVLDDVALDLLMQELDTVADFVHYLTTKERFIRGGLFLGAAGEEELLAHYLSHVDAHGRHGLEFDDDGRVILVEGMWRRFRGSGAYARKRDADRISYVWDAIIEDLARNVAQGTLIMGGDLPFEVHESSLRVMASETRLARRALASALDEVGRRSGGETMFTRFIGPRDDGLAYLFLRLSRQGEEDESYRRIRATLLEAHCEIWKLRRPTTARIVGIGFAPFDEQDGSVDNIVVDVSDWAEERAEAARGLVRSLGLKSPDELREIHIPMSEYPPDPAAVRLAADRRRAARAEEERRKQKRKSARASRKKNRR